MALRLGEMCYCPSVGLGQINLPLRSVINWFPPIPVWGLFVCGREGCANWRNFDANRVELIKAKTSPMPGGCFVRWCGLLVEVN